MNDETRVAGARKVDDPSAAPTVRGVTSNRAVFVDDLSVVPRKGNKVALIDAPTVAAVVRAVKPHAEVRLERAWIDEDGEVKTQEVLARMGYGEDNPEEVLQDFTVPAGMVKLEVKAAPNDATEIEKRPLFEQRLTSVICEALLRELMNEDSGMEKAITDPECRAAALEAIDARIKSVGVEIENQRRRALLAQAAQMGDENHDD